MTKKEAAMARKNFIFPSLCSLSGWQFWPQTTLDIQTPGQPTPQCGRGRLISVQVGETPFLCFPGSHCSSGGHSKCRTSSSSSSSTLAPLHLQPPGAFSLALAVDCSENQDVKQDTEPSLPKVSAWGSTNTLFNDARSPFLFFALILFVFMLHSYRKFNCIIIFSFLFPNPRK